MKVAVVGSGVSGLAATWLLNEHSDHEVHLYESDYRPGGHANTVRFRPNGPDGDEIDVDTGFIVLNPTTYPNFLRFLQLHPESIRPLPTAMTFSVSRDEGEFEWAGTSLRTVFCQGLRRVLDPGMWRMLYDVLRFNACARRVLLDPARYGGGEISVGEYLRREGYSEEFMDNYLIPMTAAIWSTPPDKCALEFPARTLIQFLHNHHLLQITGKPSWLTLQGGSHTYVNRILSNLPASHLHLSTPVIALTSLSVCHESPPPGTPVPRSSQDPIQFPDTDQSTTDQWGLNSISSDGNGLYEAPANTKSESSQDTLNSYHSGGATSIPLPGPDADDAKPPPSARCPLPKVRLKTAMGDEEVYDHVILACHSDAALRILRAGGAEGGITGEEEAILEMFSWSRNEVVLHSDTKLMPKNRRAWSCWNYITKSVVASEGDGIGRDEKVKADVNQVSLTYGMNDLQHIPESKYGPVLVTLNPPADMQPDDSTVIGKWRYDHPVLDTKAVRAQRMMPGIQGKRSISFAGAYLRYGFHEDGFTSGLQAALSLASIPGSSPGSNSNSTRAGKRSTTEGAGMPSVRPPFEVVIAHSDAGRRWNLNGLRELVLEWLFGWFEGSWVRRVVFGVVGYWAMVVLATIVGVEVGVV